MAGRNYRLKDRAHAAPTELSTKQENAKPKQDNPLVGLEPTAGGWFSTDR